MKTLRAVLFGLGFGLLVAMFLLLIGTIERTDSYVISPSLLYFGILVTGACIVALPMSGEVTAGLITSLVAGALVALKAETCEFSTDVLKPCVELYSTRQNLTYSVTYLFVGLVIGVTFRAWRKQRPQPQLHRVG